MGEFDCRGNVNTCSLGGVKLQIPIRHPNGAISEKVAGYTLQFESDLNHRQYFGDPITCHMQFHKVK